MKKIQVKVVREEGVQLPNSDYRGELKVIVVNLSNEAYTIEPNERIGQFVLNKVEQIEFVEVEELDDTSRGEGGFGHTGK